MVGKLVVYVGPMFSGKSGLLIAEAARLRSVGKETQFYKPGIDGRWEGIRSRLGTSTPATSIKDWSDIEIPRDPERTVIAVDEIQFMPDKGMGKFMFDAVNAGIVLLFSGLQVSTEMEPFGSTQLAVSFADDIIHTKAYCVICSGPAPFSICNRRKTGKILVGDDMYEARCREHLSVGNPNYEDLKANVSKQ